MPPEAQLQELIDRCHGDLGKQFLSDAAQAYEAHNYRSCVIMTWIAVAFDILDKISNLSDAGQANAMQYTAELEKIRASNDPSLALALERKLLTTAQTDFHLLEPIEVAHLEELQTERHRCAHPSLTALVTPYRPLPNRALQFMELAVDYILSKPPQQGRVAAEAVMQEIRSDHFPTTAGNAEERLLEGPMQYPANYLLSDVVAIIVKDCFLETLTQKQRKSRTAALVALENMHSNRVSEIYTAKVPGIFDRCTDDQLHQVILTIYRVPALMPALSSPRQLKLKKFIQSYDGDQSKIVIGTAAAIPEFSEPVTVYLKKLDGLTLKRFVGTPAEPDALKIAVDQLCNSANWDDSNTVTNSLLLPNAKKVAESDVNLILVSYVANIEIRGSFSGVKLITALFDAELQRSRDFPQYWGTFYRNLSGLRIDDSEERLLKKLKEHLE